MARGIEGEPAGGRRRVRAALVVAFFAICLGPRLRRLGHPSLYFDDLARIKWLQEPHHVFDYLLYRFNEHVAPLTQALTWALWELAGRRLAGAPLPFTLTAFAPFVACLGLVYAVVRRETGSRSAALLAVAAFNFTWVYDETVYWYSGATFMGALLWALVAWLCAASAGERGGRWAWVGAIAGALLAPACSAIGLLAGPLAGLRVLTASRRPAWGHRGRLLGALVPMIGTAGLLGLRALSRPGAGASHGLMRHAGVLADREVWLAIARAPVEVLIPAMLGRFERPPRPGILGPENVHTLPVAVVLALFGLGVAVALIGAWRSRYRALILGGLLLLLGGYFLPYTVPYGADYRYRLSVERYHLFPHLGLVLMLVAAALPLLRRLDRRPTVAASAAVVLAALLLATHRPVWLRARNYDFPDQGRTLAALDWLGEVCRRKRITRGQALDALDPIRRLGWVFDLQDPVTLIGSPVVEPALPDAEVRRELLAALSPAEVEAICGGADVSAHLVAIDDRAPGRAGLVSAPSGSHRVVDLGGGRYIMQGWAWRGWPSYLEFVLPADAGRAPGPGTAPRTLAIPGACFGGRFEMEVWWAGEDGGWSEVRSAKWRIDPSQGGWAIPLDRLPHWDPARARRLRIILRAPAELALEAPRLLY